MSNKEKSAALTADQTKNSNQIVDREQASAHLQAVGYQRGDNVFVRYINPLTKESIKSPRLRWEEAQSRQEQGFDVYFVVNPGGDNDAAVQDCRVIFYEHDDLDKEAQLNLWQTLGMPQPTIQVDTGGKSIHSFWTLEQPITQAEWRKLQADLLEFADADRTIKNPSRIMRLAGFRYMKNGGETRAQIVSNSGQLYSYDELRSFIPSKAPEAPKPLTSYNLPVTEDIPLYQCLTKDDRTLIDSGASSNRNSSGAKLARNLIGTAKRLDFLGIRYSGDPRRLFDDYCGRCLAGNGWNEREWEQIWKSAERENPTASLSDDALENCRKAWERQFTHLSSKSDISKETPDGDEETPRQKRGKKPPKGSMVARGLAERYQQKLAWNDEAECWFRYEAELPGTWSTESETAVRGVIQSELDTNPELSEGYSAGFVSSVHDLLKAYLLCKRWNQRKGVVPLQDGVLELSSMKLMPHSPGYRLTWQLPYKWSERSIGCQPVQDWMLEAMGGDAQLVQVLRAYLNAVVKRRVDLQRYLELLGPGGTGKGTFMRLAMALVGNENTYSTKLKELETNNFELAAIYGKVLLLITDAERYGGEVSQLKAITGQDPLRYEAKRKQQGRQFFAECLVVVAANEAVQSSDYTSGLERRRLTLPFVHQVDSSQRRDLEAEFKPFLSGVLEWALQMDDQEVTKLVRDTHRSVPSLAKAKQETLINTNPIAEWLDQCVIVSDSKTYVGVAKKDKDSNSLNTYQHVSTWLYANYAEYTTAVGNRVVSQRRFSEMVFDLTVHQLKLPGIHRGRDAKGSYFEGLCIRPDHDDSPQPITGLVMVNDEYSDGSVTAESTGSDGSDGCDGYFEVEKTQQQIEADPPLEDLPDVVDECEKNPEIENYPSHPSLPITNQAGQRFQKSDAAVTPVTTHHSPITQDAGMSLEEFEALLPPHILEANKGRFENAAGNASDLESTEMGGEATDSEGGAGGEAEGSA